MTVFCVKNESMNMYKYLECDSANDGLNGFHICCVIYVNDSCPEECVSPLNTSRSTACCCEASTDLNL